MNKRLWMTVVLLVVFLVVLPVVAVMAQAAETGTQPGWLTWLSGFLQNSVVLLAVGFIADRVKGFREVIRNKLIPYLQTAIGAIGALLGFFQHVEPTSMLNLLVSPANAAGLHVGHVAAFLGIGGFVGGLLSAVGAGAWSAAQSHLWYKLFLYKHLGPSPAESVQ